MVADATRGVKFVFSTAVDPDAAKAFEEMEKRVADLQKSMNLSFKLEGRAGPGANGNGANGSGAPRGGGAAARQADLAARQRERDAQRAFLTEAKWNRMAENAVNQREAAERAGRKRLSDMRREADERDRVSAERSAEKQRIFEREILEQQIKDLKRAAKERQQIIAEAAREDAFGWKRMSAMGRESFTTNRKTTAGFDALSAMGRAAMPRDRFAEGLQKLEADRSSRTGWSGLGGAGADAQQRLNALRAIERKEVEERKRALDSQKGQLREINSALYDVAHAFGQVTRAAGQFSLIGQRDMMKVLDTIFAIEGGINAVQGGMNAFRAISSIRKARAAGGGVKYAAGLARLAGGAAGAGGIGAGGVGTAAGAGGAAGGVGLGLAGAGITALAAGGIGLLGTIADRRRGVPGQVGGFWDTIGKGIASPVGAIQGGFLSLGSAIERSFNEPYGLTDKESDYRSQRLQEEEFERSYGANGADDSRYAAIKRAKLHERRTELLEKYTYREIARRGAIREQKEAEGSIRAPLESRLRLSERNLEAERYGFRLAGLQGRGGAQEQLRGEAFSRQQTARAEELELERTRALGGYVSPMQESRARRDRQLEEQRVSGFRQARGKNLDEQLKEAEGHKKTLASQYKTAKETYETIRPDATSIEGMTNAGSPTEVATAYREMQQLSQELRKSEEDILRIKEEQRKVGVEGAREQLELSQQDYEAAKRKADTLRHGQQSAIERIGMMLPEQQKSLAEAVNAAKSGNANRLQIQRLQEAGIFPEQVRDYAKQHLIPEAQGILDASVVSDRNIRQAEDEEKKSHGITESARNELASKLQEEATTRAQQNADVIIPIMEKALQFERVETQRLIQEGLDNYFRQNNQQGGVVWGNG